MNADELNWQIARDDLATHLFKENTWHTDDDREAAQIAEKCRMQADALIDQLAFHRWNERDAEVRAAQRLKTTDAEQETE